MNRRRASFLLASAVIVVELAGCSCANNNRVRYVPPPPGMNNGPMPPRYVPNSPPVVPGPNPSGTMTLPPGAVLQPPGQVTPPPGAVLQPPGQMTPPPGAAIQQNNYISPGPSPQAVVPSVYLEQPEPVATKPTMPNASAPAPETRPYTPQTAEPPPARDDKAASPALPVDIPQFATVKSNIASGQEPFTDGIAWLKKHGYRTVLHVRAPGENDDAAHKQYEQAGLRYLSLELSPQTLSKDIVDKFNRLIADNENLPLFVYDKDSSLAGALWYLHFRIVDRATEEKARDDAERLGFKQERGEAHLKMWLAVQKLLKDLNP